MKTFGQLIDEGVSNTHWRGPGLPHDLTHEALTGLGFRHTLVPSMHGDDNHGSIYYGKGALPVSDVHDTLEAVGWKWKAERAGHGRYDYEHDDMPRHHLTFWHGDPTGESADDEHMVTFKKNQG